jgi:hypothetical protein
MLLNWLEPTVTFFFTVLQVLPAGRRSELESTGVIIGALVDQWVSLSVPRTDGVIHLISQWRAEYSYPYLLLHSVKSSGTPR